MSHIPKKKFIDAAQADGTLAETSRLLSASYLMANLMWSFFDDATELLKSHGLLLGDMSRATGRLNYSFKNTSPYSAMCFETKARKWTSQEISIL